MGTAFWGTMVIQHPDSTIESDRFDCADTSLIYCTWTSNGANTFYAVKKSGYIKDITLNITAAGTTKYLKLWVNGTDTGISWAQLASSPANPTRFPNLNPIPVKAGQNILIQAIT
jgi:hypothetical protein